MGAVCVFLEVCREGERFEGEVKSGLGLKLTV